MRGCLSLLAFAPLPAPPIARMALRSKAPLLKRSVMLVVADILACSGLSWRAAPRDLDCFPMEPGFRTQASKYLDNPRRHLPLMSTLAASQINAAGP